MKSLAIEANDLEQANKGDPAEYFEELHSYNKLTTRQVRLFIGRTERNHTQSAYGNLYFAKCTDICAIILQRIDRI
jgi:hypothetical protein